MSELLQAGDDPIATIEAWFEAARQAHIANHEATALATATPDGKPSVRMVLLKSWDGRGFVFYTNYESRKARELELNPRAALAVYWEPLGRQVRIEGRVERLEAVDSDRYFASRPYESRLSACASPQSREVPSREVLEQKVAELDAIYGTSGVVPRPSFWGGYRVVPERIELWLNGAHRLHDRFEYSPISGGWKKIRLGP